MEIPKLLSQISGVAGAAGVAAAAISACLYIFRDLIARTVFPTLTKERGFKVLLIFGAFAWSIAIAGISAWAMVEIARVPPATKTKIPGPPTSVVEGELQDAKKRLLAFKDHRARRLRPDAYERAEKYIAEANALIYSDSAGAREFIKGSQNSMEILSATEFHVKETLQSSEWVLAQLRSRAGACERALQLSGEAWSSAVEALNGGNLKMFNEFYGKAQSHLGGLMQTGANPC